jgi:hypothetical protein
LHPRDNESCLKAIFVNLHSIKLSTLMRILLTLIVLATLVFTSCKKEQDSVNGGGNSNTRLIKMVAKSGSDSSVSEFTYNGSGKIVGFKLSGSDSGLPLDLRLTYVRNNSDIIQKQILKGSDLAGLGLDSIVTIVNYDAGNNRYKNAISVLILFGFSIKDSIVFQYDGNGRLVSEIDYTDAGFGMDPSTKTEYTFVGNNLAGEKYYSYDDVAATFDLEEIYAYEYDSKINPLQFAPDAPVLNMNPFYSANNITKTTYVDAIDASNNYLSNDTYTYTSVNRPATSKSVTGSNTVTTTYFYQ